MTTQTAAYPRPRRACREVRVGAHLIGGDHPVRVQSMTSADTADPEATLAQIDALVEAGCEIVRVTVDTPAAARALPAIRAHCPIPLVADIHFNHKLALAAAPYVDKIRINPGNIGDEDRVRAVVERADEFGLPIRIGVNQGSLEREIALQYGAHERDGFLMPPEGGYPARALADSALRNVAMLERHGFRRILISVKSSNVPLTVEAYRLVAAECDYPLHLGVTEAGTRESSAVKSSAAMGALLLDGIGDTLRVSIAGRAAEDKVAEVLTGFRLLQALGLRRFGMEVISCPTCGRESQGFNTARIATELERWGAGRRRPVKVAVMGCQVNGPGEAADADVGVIATGRTARILVRGREAASRVPFDEVLGRVCAIVESLPDGPDGPDAETTGGKTAES